MRRHFLLGFWIVTDVILFLASYALAYFTRVGWYFSSTFPFDQYMLVALMVVPVWLAILVSTRTFALMRNQMSLRAFSYVLYGNTVALALFTLAYFFLYGLFFSRLLLVEAFLFSTLILWAWHVLMDSVRRNALRRSPPAFPTLVIGATREAASVIKMLQSGKSPLVPVGILDSTGSKEKHLHDVPVIGKLDKLEKTLNEKGITHLIQTSDLEHTINLLSACRKKGITYILLPSVLGIVERDERVELLEGRPVTVVRPKESALKWFFS